MFIVLMNREAGHDKFYAMLESKEECMVVSFWGKISAGITTGCTKPLIFKTPTAASQFLDKKMQEKEGKGYKMAASYIADEIVSQLKERVHVFHGESKVAIDEFIKKELS